jgi:hypothetical protein
MLPPRIAGQTLSAIGHSRRPLVHRTCRLSGAGMTFCWNPRSRWLFGVQRTLLFAAHISACDPSATSIIKGDNVTNRLTFLQGYCGDRDFSALECRCGVMRLFS